MTLEIDDYYEVNSRAEYQTMLQSWSSQTSSEAVWEYDGPGLYKPVGWNNHGERAKCTLSRVPRILPTRMVRAAQRKGIQV